MARTVDQAAGVGLLLLGSVSSGFIAYKPLGLVLVALLPCQQFTLPMLPGTDASGDPNIGASALLSRLRKSWLILPCGACCLAGCHTSLVL